MARVLHLPAGGVVLDAADATDLARAVLAAQEMASRRGAYFKPRILVLAAELTSLAGDPEVARVEDDEHVEYEQIDADTAAHLLGCSPRNVRDLAARGRIPAVKRAGRWCFNRDDILVHRDYR